MDDVQVEIKDLIVNAFSREFWLNVLDSLHAKYAASEEITRSDTLDLGLGEKNRLRPQIRHYTLNAALRRAAEASGIFYRDSCTDPKGENYVVVESNGIKLSRIGMNFNDKGIKAAKHRTLLAELNSALEGVTPDMFLQENTGIEKADSTLGVFLININPPSDRSQFEMLDLRIVVPFSNLNGFHFNKSANEILEYYNDIGSKNIIPDNVLPRLKVRLKEQEDE